MSNATLQERALNWWHANKVKLVLKARVTKTPSYDYYFVQSFAIPVEQDFEDTHATVPRTGLGMLFYDKKLRVFTHMQVEGENGNVMIVKIPQDEINVA